MAPDKTTHLPYDPHMEPFLETFNIPYEKEPAGKADYIEISQKALSALDILKDIRSIADHLEIHKDDELKEKDIQQILDTLNLAEDGLKTQNSPGLSVLPTYLENILVPYLKVRRMRDSLVKQIKEWYSSLGQIPKEMLIDTGNAALGTYLNAMEPEVNQSAHMLSFLEDRFPLLFSHNGPYYPITDGMRKERQYVKDYRKQITAAANAGRVFIAPDVH